MKESRQLAIFGLACLGLVGLLLCVVIAGSIGGTDWESAFRPAVLARVQGEDPYQYGFYNPPWTLWLLVPFALLPPPFDHAVLMFVSAVAFAYVAKKMGAKPWALLLVFLSPPVMSCLLHGQLEWLVLLGLVVPFRWALLLLLIKPQVGIVVALFLCWRRWPRWRAKGMALADLGPIIGALVVSFFFHGFWPIHMLDVVGQTFAWPYLIPLGGALLYKAWNDQDFRAALMAAPCLSPHAWPYSFSGVVIALVQEPGLLAVVVAGMWAVKLLC